MEVVFRIPKILGQYAQGICEFHLTGDSVRSVLLELQRRYPAVHHCLCDERGILRRHLHLFINDQLLVGGVDFDAPLHTGDVISVFQAVSGG